MKFRQYQKYASKTLQKKFSDVFFGLALAGEVGEVCNLIKKQKRDGVSHRERILEECGDCLWYLTMLVESLDSTLEEVAVQNLEKLEDRYDEEAGGKVCDK